MSHPSYLQLWMYSPHNNFLYLIIKNKQINQRLLKLSIVLIQCSNIFHNDKKCFVTFQIKFESENHKNTWFGRKLRVIQSNLHNKQQPQNISYMLQIMSQNDIYSFTQFMICLESLFFKMPHFISLTDINFGKKYNQWSHQFLDGMKILPTWLVMDILHPGVSYADGG